MAPEGTDLAREADRVEHAVLERVRPDAETLRKVEEARGRLVRRAEAIAAELGFPVVRALVAGSAARGTFVRDRLDLDFFFLFPPTLPREELERMGLELGSRLLEDSETRYAEHPYRRGRFEGFTVDAVPGYAVDDPSRPLTAVDRTPFHQEYLARRETPASVDQIRLAKQFLRGIGVYGSEARRGGFSGYLVELLVLRFGSLRGLLRDAVGWRIPVDFRSSPGAAPRVPEEVALVLDDPVDAQRNVATALTRRNLGLFVLGARAYLAHPTEEWFVPADAFSLDRATALERIRVRATHVTALALPRPSLVDDILFPQLRKAERAVTEEARRLGFTPLRSSSAAGPTDLVVLLEVEQRELPWVRLHGGPPVGVDRSDEFLEKWADRPEELLQGPYVSADGRLAVELRRGERSVEALLTEAIPRLPIGRDLRELIGAEVRFRPVTELADSAELREAFGELLDLRLPWLARDRISAGRR